MGRAKLLLPFGGEVLLQRVVRLVGSVVRPVVVVGARGQRLPELPDEVTVAHDRYPDRGPLEGLAVGLERLAKEAWAAFATGCDVPLLVPAVVVRLVELLADNDVVVPTSGAHAEPLLAVYRTAVLPAVEALLAAGERRPAALFDRVRTRRIPLDQLRGLDPQLRSLMNVNSPEDYHRALAMAGLPLGDRQVP